MTLIETFRNETADDEDFRATPSSDQSDAQNMLYFPTGLGFGKLKALPLANEVEYPERDLADKLVRLPFARAHMMSAARTGLLTRHHQVDAYFERVHFLLPVLDRPSFLERYQRLMDNNGMGEKPGFVAVVFAVFACAARFLDDPRIKLTHYSDPRSTAMIFYERFVLSMWARHHLTYAITGP
jgi:Fungal specific transcription factor domain